jgi:hypothetical protein
MSPANEPLTQFERNVRTVLEEGVSRIDGRTRSRLNQARHAALQAATRQRRPLWSRFTLVPAAGALAAAALVAVMLWHREPQFPEQLEGQRMSVEDMDLLADGENLDLLQEDDGTFYEWAAAQTDASGASEG